ncbi:MAG: phosphotransferase [Turicibacter sp.]|nr:phosphotransferase [Turicibacter sp.]
MKLLNVLYALNENTNYSQRELARICKISIGAANATIKEAIEKGYLVVVKTGAKNQYQLTEQGIQLLDEQLQDERSKKIKIHLTEQVGIHTAVILAAGKRPDFDVPVAFLEVEKKPLIERTIDVLSANQIDHIIIVTGYKSDHFDDLARKNPKVKLVENKQYQSSGTMASLALAKAFIETDFLLLESDLIFEEQAITRLLQNENRDCMIITNESGSKDEAFVEIRNGYLYNMTKDIHQLNKIDGEMIGLSKISYDVFKKMLERFTENKNPYLNYEYMLMDIGREYKIGFEKIANLVWYEIDSQEHYETFTKKILRKLKHQEEKIRAEEIKELLHQTLEIKKEAIKNIELVGGMTNHNYKVTLSDKDYILRIPGSGTDDMISRKNEYVNCQQANQLGLDAKIIYLNAYDGLKIAEFIEGAETLNASMAKRDDMMSETVSLLRKLHRSNVAFGNEFDVFKEIHKYDALNKEAEGYFFDDYEATKVRVLRLERLLDQLDRVRIPCHNDTVPENFIRDAAGRFYLVDWEYSGYNDPMWDLAAHSLECGFSDLEEALLLQKYFEDERVEEKYFTKVLIFQICQDFLWSIWTCIKEAKGDDFGSYGSDRYLRAKRNLERIERFE